MTGLATTAGAIAEWRLLSSLTFTFLLELGLLCLHEDNRVVLLLYYGDSQCLARFPVYIIEVEGLIIFPTEDGPSLVGLKALTLLLR